MIAYAIRNKKDGRFVYGFDYKTNINNPKMMYINKENDLYRTPKLFSEVEVKSAISGIKELIPKCCELVKVEIKELKDDEI